MGSFREDGSTGKLDVTGNWKDETAFALAQVARQMNIRNQIETKRNEMLDGFFDAVLTILRERE